MDFSHRKIKVTDTRKLTEQLHDLFFAQPLAVLSTQDKGQPYCNLVAFAVTDDMKDLIFATARATRKYANLTHDRRVSMLIDNRTNQVEDFHNAMAVTATGKAFEVSEDEKVTYLKLYLNKHPHLEEFVISPDCALLRIQVDKYYIVKRFQNVMVLQFE